MADNREQPIKPVKPPPPPPPPFPGFAGLVQTATRDSRAANKTLQESESALVMHNQGKWQWQLPRPKRSVQEWIALGRPGPFSDFSGGQIPAVEAWAVRQEELLLERRLAVRQLGRATWFQDFYDALPNLMDAGVVNTLEEYLALMKSDPTGILSEQDFQTARDTITKITGTQPAQPREDAPEWLQITPEEAQAVRVAFALEPEPPETIHKITVDQLLKSLTRQPSLDLPEDMTPEQLLQFASIMDIPAEEISRAIEYEELVQPFALAIAEREEQIKAVLAGEEEWQMPELSLGQQLMFTVLSPMQAAADVIRPYLEKVSYPIAGFAAYSVSRFLSGTQDIEDKYARMKELGYSNWQAMSEAYQDWDWPWYAKLALEIATDPITYTPGLLLSVPSKLLVRTPFAATRAVGIGLTSVNRGLWSALDVPFDAAKAFWANLPKSFSQATKFELNAFRDLIITTSTKQSGKIVSMLTPADLTTALEKSMKAFIDTPMKQGDVFVDLGAELIKHAPLDIKSVQIWSRSLGGKLDAVTPEVLNAVEDVVSDAILKLGSPAQNAKRLAIALGVEDNPIVIGKIIKDIGVITNKYAVRVPRAIEIGKTAKISPTLQMTEYLVSGQRKIIQAIERSEYAKGKAFSGTILGLMNKVDKLERGVFRMTLDRWLVRPMAEAYLGSVAYPIWNAFEGMFVSALEGVVPRMAKQEAFQRMFIGVRGVDNRVMQWSASDVAGMLGSMPGREGGISLLPGKVPEKIVGLKTPKWIAGKDWFEWTGRKWIELSDVWGTGYRANFLMRKMANFLAEFSYSVSGQDLNVAFRKLIGKPPGISKKSIGLTEHELKQEMFARLTSGNKADVLAMKELLSNNSLMQGEALKILRQATELSPQAKTLGEQMIARGTLKTEDDVLTFAKTVADQSVADLRAYPTAAPEAFRFMADQMEALAAKKPVARPPIVQVRTARIVEADLAATTDAIRFLTKETQPTESELNLIVAALQDAGITDKELLKLASEGLPPSQQVNLWVERLRVDAQGLRDELGQAVAGKPREVQLPSPAAPTEGIETADDLMQVFQHFEVMSDTASRVPIRLLGQVMEEADELKRLGKFNKLETLWRTSRQDVEQVVDSIGDSLNRARAVIENKAGLLTEPQQNALLALLQRNTARLQLQEQFLRFDGRLLDDFWALPKAQRTSAEHTALRAFRQENIVKFRGEDAVLGAGDFLERKTYSQLYHSLPRPRLIHVDASSRALTADDAAKTMGANVDALTTGMMESMTFQDKAYFIQMIKQSADANPSVFKGFTEDKIGAVYDDIISGLRMTPGQDIATQKILQQVENVKQRMLLLRMNKSLNPTEEKALHGWIDDVAEGMDNVFGKEVETIPSFDVGLGEQVATAGETKATAKELELLRKAGVAEGDISLVGPRPEVTIDVARQGEIRETITKAAEDVTVPADVANKLFPIKTRTDANLRDLVDSWFANSDNDVLQALGKSASENVAYLRKIRKVLNEEYPSGHIRLYRGGGTAVKQGEKPLEREFTNVTSSRRTAVDFEDTWSAIDLPEIAFKDIYKVEGTYSEAFMSQLLVEAETRGFKAARIHDPQTGEIFEQIIPSLLPAKKEPSIDNILVKVDDIVAMGAVEESEMVISAAILKKRIDNPLKPPVRTEGALVTKGQWEDIRQKASDSAHREYYKAFADYTNENIIDAVGKSIYPFWTYHMYRWFFLPRTFIRKPGTMAAWGKYYEYSDYGYQHIPGTDIEFNPAIGSAFGATFSLGRHDFKSYYENLGFAGEVLDFTQRRGFFPGIHVTLPIALTAVFSDRPPELGEILPPLHRVGLNLLVNSEIPGVADAARWLKDRVFHENFHEYYTATIASRIQSDAGGKLIDGQSGADLWLKKQRGEAFTEEEEALWDDAYKEAAWIAILRSEFPEFRLRAEEMLEAHEQVTALIEAQTGMDADFQNNLWRHNLRPADVIGGLPADLKMALDQMWQWRIYFGRGAILMPPEYSDLFGLIDKYRGKIEGYQIERLGLQMDTNKGFLQPTPSLHFDGSEWRREYANNWSSYVSLVESLEADPEYADAIDAMTPEGQIRLAKELSFTPPPIDPFNEAVRLYFEIELHKKKDLFTGEEDFDYLRFWLERESVRQTLTDAQRDDFDTYVRRFQTPMEVVFKNVSNTYLRGYRAISRIVLEEFSEDEKALIAEFYADTTTRERKLEIQAVESQAGRKLISLWNSRRTNVREALRRESPTLDFWLFVFGYITSPKSDEAKAMVDAWEKDKTSIVQGITESPMLEEVIQRIDTKVQKETQRQVE